MPPAAAGAELYPNERTSPEATPPAACSPKSSIGTRPKRYGGSNQEVVRVQEDRENASCGFLGRFFSGAGWYPRGGCQETPVREDERLQPLGTVSEAHAALG